jgi:hypothetical protein
LREDAPTPMEDEVSKRAFEQFNSVFQAAPILQTPEWNKPLLVYCDAFGEAVGSTLSQLDENGLDHPIHFAINNKTSVEKKLYYDQTKRSCSYFLFKEVLPLFVGIQNKNCD